MALRTGLFILLLALSALPVLAQRGSSEELLRRGQSAGVDAALLEAVEDRGRESGLTASQRAELIERAVLLAERGLPAEALLSKTLEGLAKQIPVSRLVPVLEQMQQQTITAGQIIDSWLMRPEVGRLVEESRHAPGRDRVLVSNLAEALTHGVPRATIDAVLDRLPAEAKRASFTSTELGTALGVLADLPSAKVDPEATARLVVSALNAGYSEAEIRQLPLAMKAVGQSGASPAHAANEVAREMSRGTPADQVLHDLFQGDFPGQVRGPGNQSAEPGPPPGVGPDDANPNRGPDGSPGRGQRNSAGNN